MCPLRALKYQRLSSPYIYEQKSMIYLAGTLEFAYRSIFVTKGLAQQRTTKFPMFAMTIMNIHQSKFRRISPFSIQLEHETFRLELD